MRKIATITFNIFVLIASSSCVYAEATKPAQTEPSKNSKSAESEKNNQTKISPPPAAQTVRDKPENTSAPCSKKCDENKKTSGSTDSTPKKPEKKSAAKKRELPSKKSQRSLGEDEIEM